MIPPAPLGPVPDLSKPEAKKEEELPDKSTILNALNLSWCFGYNKNIGLLNLCVNETKKIISSFVTYRNHL